MPRSFVVRGKRCSGVGDVRQQIAIFAIFWAGLGMVPLHTLSMFFYLGSRSDMLPVFDESRSAGREESPEQEAQHVLLSCRGGTVFM